MLNVIRMDFYRMFKSKITWAILILVGFLAVSTMFTYHREHEFFANRTVESLMAEGFTQAAAEEQLAADAVASDPMYAPDSIFDVFYFYPKLIVNNYISLFICVFVILFIGAESSTGFLKNIAGQGGIRHRTILSKCLCIFLFASIILLMFFIITLTCSKVLFGYISFGLYSPTSMLAYTLTQLFLITSLCIVVMCISELIRNQAFSMVFAVLLPLEVLRLLTRRLDGLIPDFSFSSQLITVNISELPQVYDVKSYQHVWVASAIFLVFAIVISIFSKTKRDIR